MNYLKPISKVHSIYDVQQYEALAGSASCGVNTGNVCGTQFCICVMFCFKKK